MNRNLIIALVVVVVIAVVYFAWSMIAGSGGSVPDITAGGKVPSPAAAPAAQPSAPQQPSGAQQNASQGGIGAVGTPLTGGGGQGASAGQAPAPKQAPPEGPKGPEISKPSEKAPTGKQANAGGKEAPVSVEKALAGFKTISPSDIMGKKYDDLRKSLTDPKDLRFDSVGRNDVLTVVQDALPEELRPPRTGETNEDLIRKYFQSYMGTMLVNEVDVQVHSVLAVGMVRFVNIEVDGERFTAAEGDTIRAANGATVTIASASDSQVVVVIEALGVTKTRTFIR
jgi:hypothetical protein